MHVFLSPHFDDAVLSCGGTIHRLTQRGESVLVLTIMGRNPFPDEIPDTPIVRDLHSRWQSGADPVSARIQEDSAAVHHLGAPAEIMTLWADCIYRVSAAGIPVYLTGDAIFGPPHPDDPALLDQERVRLPDAFPVTTLYAPLGVGNHVDHQLVRNWALKLTKANPLVALKFYEEYPYTRDASAVSGALTYFAGLNTLSVQTVYLDEQDVTAKIQAIGCYQSQISTFWDSLEAMAQAVRYAVETAGQGQPAERFWQITGRES